MKLLRPMGYTLKVVPLNEKEKNNNFKIYYKRKIIFTKLCLFDIIKKLWGCD